MTDDTIVEQVVRNISEGNFDEFTMNFKDWAQFGRVMARLAEMGIHVDSNGEVTVAGKSQGEA